MYVCMSWSCVCRNVRTNYLWVVILGMPALFLLFVQKLYEKFISPLMGLGRYIWKICLCMEKKEFCYNSPKRKLGTTDLHWLNSIMWVPPTNYACLEKGRLVIHHQDTPVRPASLAFSRTWGICSSVVQHCSMHQCFRDLKRLKVDACLYENN